MIKNIQTVKTLLLYGLSHSLVDATCVIVLYCSLYLNRINPDYTFALIMIVLYNIIAFGAQCIIGNIFDRLKKPQLSAFIGCILAALSVFFIQNKVLATLFAGFGNAFFHVGGGIVALKLAKYMNKEGKELYNASIPGIFVAPGAIGLFVGAYIAQSNCFSANTYFPIRFLFLILILFATLIYCHDVVFKYTDNNTPAQKVNKEQNIYYNIVSICNLLLLAIVFRSFIGLSIIVPWKENIHLAFCLALSVAAGKFFGGIIADKYGWLKVSVIALIISSPFIAFGINFPELYIVGIFFFNFTMPVTLAAISNLLPNKEGFSFGLTTLALVIGALPALFGFNLSNKHFIIFVIIVISALLIYFGLKEYQKILNIKQENNN